MHSSTLFTVGTALRRAEDNGLPVEVLVHGHWLRGTVVGVDGQGVILSTHAEHSVVRLGGRAGLGAAPRGLPGES